MSHGADTSEVIFLPPGSGRSYQAGPMRAPSRAGALNLFLPGGFEEAMPAIVDWFAAQNDADPAKK